MVIEEEMLDQPIPVIIFNSQMMIIQNLMDPAFQEIFDADPGGLQYRFFGGPKTEKGLAFTSVFAIIGVFTMRYIILFAGQM